MADFFACKRCGGRIVPLPDGKTGKCESCGAAAVIPRSDVNLLNRANEFRRRLEFDQAQMIYRSIAKMYPEEPEAWWGSFLCEYGIDYVEADGERKPTVNRMKFDSVFDNEDYKQAVSKADEETRAIYQADAKTIQDIQEGMLKIAAKQDPYEVFICYKETGENNERTLDSVMAQDMYDLLTKEGYKVFFARQTLRGCAGQDYEPIIYSALTSSALMLAVGTKPEHFEAPWVKNEWSRYRRLMRTDPGKHLIPVYAEMSPKDLPREFASLQGLDGRKLGFEHDLLENVNQLTGRKKEERLKKESAYVTLEQELQSLVKRAETAMENGRDQNANDYYREALELDETYAQAWWGRFLLWGGADYKRDFMTDETLRSCFEKAREYAAGELKAQIEEWYEGWKEGRRQFLFKKARADYDSFTYGETRCDTAPDFWKRVRDKQEKILSLAREEEKAPIQKGFQEYKELFLKKHRDDYDKFTNGETLCDTAPDFWKKVRDMQEKILSLAEEEEKASMQNGFLEYEELRKKVERMRAELEKHKNRAIHRRMEAESALEAAKEQYAQASTVRIWPFVLVLVLFVPNFFFTGGAGPVIGLVLGGIMGYIIYTRSSNKSATKKYMNQCIESAAEITPDEIDKVKKWYDQWQKKAPQAVKSFGKTLEQCKHEIR